MASFGSMAPTRRGQECALKAEAALREGRLEEAKTWHKNASNAFKEARDALLEGDASTRMALTILIDYHRDREKNPGDPKQVHLKSHPVVKYQLLDQPSASLSNSGSVNSISEAWNAVQEFGESVQASNTPPPIPESLISSKAVVFNNTDWKRGTQSVMAESYYFVGGETIPPLLGAERSSSINSTTRSRDATIDKLQIANKTLSNDMEKLARENAQLRTTILKEREEAKAQREKFWTMFVLVKSALEDARIPMSSSLTPSSPSITTSHESELKALTRLLHAETEARKKAEAELNNLKRRFD